MAPDGAAAEAPLLLGLLATEVDPASAGSAEAAGNPLDAPCGRRRRPQGPGRPLPASGAVAVRPRAADDQRPGPVPGRGTDDGHQGCAGGGGRPLRCGAPGGPGDHAGAVRRRPAPGGRRQPGGRRHGGVGARGRAGPPARRVPRLPGPAQAHRHQLPAAPRVARRHGQGRHGGQPAGGREGLCGSRARPRYGRSPEPTWTPWTTTRWPPRPARPRCWPGSRPSRRRGSCACCAGTGGRWASSATG